MKVRKRGWLLFLAAIILIVCGIGTVACAGPGKSDEVVLCGFESQEEMRQMLYYNAFGKMEIISSPEHAVTQGEHAAELFIDGNETQGEAAKPAMVMYTETEFLPKFDYSDVTAFRIDIYNAMEEEVKFYFSFSVKTGGTSSVTEVTLQPNCMNEVEIPFDRGFLIQLIDIKNVWNFKFAFDNKTSADQERRHLYLDNFRAVLTGDPIPQGVKIRKEHELESADRPEYLNAWTTVNNQPAELSFNDDPKYIKEGTGSFKFTTIPTGGDSWPSFWLSTNQLTDLSDYYSISLWIYNDNDRDIQFRTFSNVQVRWALKKQWTKFEFTIEELSTLVDEALYNPAIPEDEQSYRYDIKNFKNFNLGVTCHNEVLTFYIDGFYANLENENAPVMKFENYTDTVEPGTVYEVPVPEVSNGTVFWEIIGPDGKSIAKDAESFVPQTKGEYTISYTASNPYESVQKTISLYVGYYPVITQDRMNEVTAPGSYEIPVPEVANDGDLSWRIFKIQHSFTKYNEEPAELEANAESVVLNDNDLIRIEYTAVNEEGTRTAERFVKCDSGMRLDEIYTDVYEKGLTGFKISNNPAYAFTGTDSLLLSGQGTASGVWAPGVYLNREQSQFNFMVYNASAEDAHLLVGKANTFVVPAGEWRMVDFIPGWYKDWGVIDKNTLVALNMTASSMGEIALYFDCFTVHFGNGGPILTVPGDAIFEGKADTAFVVPIAAAEDNSEVTWQIYDPNGQPFGDLNVPSITPTLGGEYRIVYTSTNVFGTSTLVKVLFIEADLPVFELPFYNRVVDVGKYTIEAPAVTNCDNLTWTAYLYPSLFMTKSNAAETVLTGNPTEADLTHDNILKIVYKAENAGGSVSATQYILCDAGRKLDSVFGDTAESGLVTNLSWNTDARYVLSGNASLRLTGTDRAIGTWSPNLVLNGSLTRFVFMMYNAADNAVTVSFGANFQSTDFTLPAGAWYMVDLLPSWYEDWGVIENGILKKLTFTVSGEAINVYADMFSVHSDHYGPALTFAQDDVFETELRVSFRIPQPVASGAVNVSWKLYDSVGNQLGSDNLETYIFEQGGNYQVVYTAENVWGTTVIPRDIKVLADLPKIGEMQNTAVASGNYTPTAPEVTNGEIVGWEAWLYRGSVLGAAAPEAMHYEGGSIELAAGDILKIVWTAANGDGEQTATQWIVCDMGYKLDQNLYPEDAYRGEGVLKISDGNAVIEETSDARYVFGEGTKGTTGIRISGTGTVSSHTVYQPVKYLNKQVDSLKFLIYNAGAEAVNVMVGYVGDGQYVLEPGVYKWVEINLQHFREKGLITANNVLDYFFIYVSGQDVEVYVDLITMQLGAGAGTVIELEEDAARETYVGTEYEIPKATAQDGSAISWKIINESGETLSENAERYTFEQAGTYRIVYTAAGAWDYGTAQTLEFNVVAVLNVPKIGEMQNTAVASGNYTPTAPEVTNGEIVGWEAWLYRGSVLGAAAPEAMHYEGGSIELAAGDILKIVWTAANGDGEQTATQWIVCDMGYKLDQNLYPEDAYRGEGVLKISDGNAVIEETSDARYVFGEGTKGTTGIRISGTGTVSSHTVYQPVKYLNKQVDSLKFLIYNAGAEAVNVMVGYVGDGQYVLEPGVYKWVEINLQHFREKGLITANNVLDYFFIYVSGQDVEVYVDLITMQLGAGAGTVIELEEDAARETYVGTEYEIPKATAQDGSAISWKIINESGETLSENAERYTFEQAGTYRIVYTAAGAWDYGTAQTLEFNVVVSEA